MDMRFYWMNDRAKQGHFDVYWAAGKTNRGDYFTKHHPPAHHKRVRPMYLHTGQANFGSAELLRGCVETPDDPSDSAVDSLDSGLHRTAAQTAPMTAADILDESNGYLAPKLDSKRSLL